MEMYQRLQFRYLGDLVPQILGLLLLLLIVFLFVGLAHGWGRVIRQGNKEYSIEEMIILIIFYRCYKIFLKLIKEKLYNKGLLYGSHA
jgi:hypothetical protein